MDSNQFREFGYKAIDYVANYIDKIRDRYVCTKFISISILRSFLIIQF